MFPMMPKNPVRLWAQFARMSIEAQMVIGLRTAGMMGMMAQAPWMSAKASRSSFLLIRTLHKILFKKLQAVVAPP